MKKALILFTLLLIVAAIVISCNQRKALDQILQNPEMKSYLMTKMMSDPAIKEEITTQLLADSAWVSDVITRMGEQMTDRQLMFSTLLNYEGMGDIMLEKMAENPELKKRMKEIGNRK